MRQAVRVVLAALTFTFFACLPQAQTLTVLHNFTDGTDGAWPEAGLTMTSQGTLYGTTFAGGYFNDGSCISGCGTVFEVKRAGSGWIFNPLYAFRGYEGAMGWQPTGGVAAYSGALFGTTSNGFNGGGTVFRLTSPPTAPRTAVFDWSYALVYQFNENQAAHDPQGDLALDRTGNMYGTTIYGGGTGCGGSGCGAVYEISPAGGGWTGQVINYFQGSTSGGAPYGGVVLDSSENLYGTLAGGGLGYGVVYKLVPSGSGWVQFNLYEFTGGSDGAYPSAGLIFDQAGNLYGTTGGGGGAPAGTVFELSPNGQGGWTFKTLYTFTGQLAGGPAAKLTIDAAGNLYGTTYADGAFLQGSVFKLSPFSGSWSYTSLHDFSGAPDGAFPISDVTLDVAGNLYGTTRLGGTGGGGLGNGMVWEVTP